MVIVVNLSYLLVLGRLQVSNSLIDTETMNLGAGFWKAIYNKFVSKKRKEQTYEISKV